MVADEIETVLEPRRSCSSERVIGQDRTRSTRSPSASAPSRAGLDDPRKPDRRLPARRPERRRQDRNRAGPGRHPLRRRAQHDHHQHVRVPGGAHGLDAEGLAAGLRRLRRGRRADRGRAAQALLASCCSTRSRRRTPTCWSSSTRCSTRACWRTARAARSTSRTRVILLTSNAGTDTIMKLCADPETTPDAREARRGAQAGAATRSSSRPSSGACRSSRTTRSRTR